MSQFRGVVPGVVKSLDDPDAQGRIKVSFPRLPGQNRSYWASVAAPMAGKNRGFFFQPELEDEVLVAFEECDPQHPFIIGFMWNGADNPPAGANSSVRRLRTVSGHVLEFDDRSGQEKVTLTTHGGHVLEFDDQPGQAQVKLTTQGGQKITLTDVPPGITITTTGGTQISLKDTPPTVEISSNLLVTVSGALVQVEGILQADTIIANSIISPLYTPGVGNLLGL